MATANDEEILEGFLCPICKADLKSASQLTSHFESLHQEEQDVLKSLKEIFGKAKKIILNNDDTDLKETFDRALKFSYQESYYLNEEQTVGVYRSTTDYLKAVRGARLERYATETNKLLIRLDKLVCNMPSDPNQRKLHEQEVSKYKKECLNLHIFINTKLKSIIRWQVLLLCYFKYNNIKKLLLITI